jgi:alanyl-tRNA synthetase
MEFNRKADGSLEKLPAQHVDTGMGFERLCVVLQGKQSNYDTDVFQPLIQKIEEASSIRYKQDEKTDIAMRVIADHIRTIAFAIADAQLPSNNKAGYVIRRILRRAVRYGYTFLNFREPFLCKLVPILAAQMGKQFPELLSQQDLIEKVVHEEESSFLKTLETGIQRFNDFVAKNTKNTEMSGSFAFELFDTFGFPIDLTQLMAREQGIKVDMNGYDEKLKEQKIRSRSAAQVEAGDWITVLEDEDEEFIGYDFLNASIKITKYREVNTKGKKHFQLTFNVTPFYAESGGQVGDTGFIEANGERIQVVDTRKEHGQIVHFTERLPKSIAASFTAQVDERKRTETMRNHSATHLLHAALRKVLGAHVEQKGSLVNADNLRFDFSHFAKVSTEELKQIEQLVNQKIRENVAREIQIMQLEDAKKNGAMALFGEKYGDLVRVISFDKQFSVELCGGTHVQATGNIGYFRIISEGAVAAGVRRIEAVSGEKAEMLIREESVLLSRIKEQLQGSKDPLKGIVLLQEENQALNRKLEAFGREKARQIKQELIGGMMEADGIKRITALIDLESADLVKNLAFDLKNQFQDGMIVLGSMNNGKPMITIALGDIVLERGFNAVTMIKELSREINGGGGGQAFYATAGGSKPEGLDSAIAKAKQLFN